MGKTIGTIAELAGLAAIGIATAGAGIALATFGTLSGVTFGGIGLGTLGAAGIASFSAGERLLQKSPKPTTTEPAAKPHQSHEPGGGDLSSLTLVGFPSPSVKAGLGRRGRDDLFEADRHGQTYL